MIIKRASIDDLDIINNFYRNVCSNSKGMDENAKWNYDIYPNEDIIRNFIESNCFYLFFEGSELVAVSALIDGQEPLFDDVNWSSKLNNREISEIRVLALSPVKQKTGLAQTVMREIEEYLRNNGKKVIRLCVIDSNRIAEKFYNKCNFKFVGEKLDTTPGISWKTLNFYEKYL